MERAAGSVVLQTVNVLRWIAVLLLAGGGALAQPVDMRQTGLVGTLEAPDIVVDPAVMPKQFHEAPALAALVKQGKLPSVEQRLPAEPLVLKPLRATGTYGGTWRHVAARVSWAGRRRERQSYSCR
jgi:hypothetical protein